MSGLSRRSPSWALPVAWPPAAVLGGCGGGSDSGGASGPPACAGGTTTAPCRSSTRTGPPSRRPPSASASSTRTTTVEVGRGPAAGQPDQQLPDIYSNILGIPLAALVNERWLGEVTLSRRGDRPAAGRRVHRGHHHPRRQALRAARSSAYQQYAAPPGSTTTSSPRPARPRRPPRDLRRVPRGLREDRAGGGYAPMTLALGGAGRMRDQIDDLAQAAASRVTRG